MSTYKNGDKKVAKLVIREISTDINSNGLISIAVIPNELYSNNVWQTTADNLERMAKNVGFFDRFSFAKSVNSASDDSYLVLPLTWCEEGQEIGRDEDGNQIKSKKGSTVFEKSFFNVDILQAKIEASDDVIDFVKEITKIIAIDLGKEAVRESQSKAREEKRKRELERLGYKADDAKPTTETDGLGS